MTRFAIPSETSSTLFVGGGEVVQRCRAIDWSATSLGPIEGWSAALRTAVRMTMECPFPINLWCGPELLLIYNDAYIAALGAKHPASLGRPGNEVWSEIWPEIAPMFDRIREGGPAEYAENARFVMERRSGPPSEAWFTFSLSPIRDEAGDVVAFLNVATETTERVLAIEAAHEARAAAERAEHQLREVFSQAPAFMAVLRGPRHVFEFANEAYARLVNNREIIGKPVIEALPEVTGQGFVALLDRVLTTGVPHVGRATPVMLERAGEATLVYLDFVYQPLTDAHGERTGIVVHGADVTESVRARFEIERLWIESEQARANAQESESRYRFLANSIPVQVWTATPEGVLDYVSDLTAQYFGKTPEQVIGDQWLGVLHPDDVEPTVERWRQSIATGEPYEVEFRLWSAAHGGYRWHLGRATAQRGEGGAIIHWFGTNTEIEERKRAESALHRLTIEATEANRAKSDFLAAMSHELRTPLNAIGGYAQLIEMGVRGPVTEEQRVDLLKIQRSKTHLDTLVSDVLNFAKLGSGRIEFRPRALGVRQTLDAVIEMIMPQLEQKGLRLAPHATPNDAAIMADEDRTRQILLNLFANALKFTGPNGLITPSVSVGDAAVSIGVTDTGIGIPEDQLERIFEPFVQARRTVDPLDHGFGLGLAISRQLARAMGGDLTVQSIVGEGSTFTVTLPRADLGPRAAG